MEANFGTDHVRIFQTTHHHMYTQFLHIAIGRILEHIHTHSHTMGMMAITGPPIALGAPQISLILT